MSSFHVRHDFNPSVARDTLLLLHYGGVDTEEKLLQDAFIRDLELGRHHSASKILASLRDLQLLERARAGHSQLVLNSHGVRLAEIAARDAVLFVELIHLRYQLLWSPKWGGDYSSWAYCTVCEYLWNEAPCSIDSKQLAALVIQRASQELGESSISFSVSSVLGILHWLRALQPGCIFANTFRRRASCAPETLILALITAQQLLTRTSDQTLRLDTQMINVACRMTLLDKARFDEVIAQAIDAFGIVRRSGSSGDMLMVHPFVWRDWLPQNTENKDS